MAGSIWCDGYFRHCHDEVHDPTRRHPDRTDRDPDVVAVGGTHGGDGKNSGLSAGGDDVRDRRAGRAPDMDRAAWCSPRLAATAACVDRRGRRAVWLSRAVFSRAALRAAGGSGPVELSLATIDRAVFLVAAG